MAKKKFQQSTRYNPIESQLAADVAGPAPVPEARAEPARVAPSPREELTPQPAPRVEAAPVATVAPVRKKEAEAPTTAPEPVIEKKFRIEKQAFLDFEDLLLDIRRETGSQIPYAIATRALWGLCVQARSEILAALKAEPLGRLPSTKDPVAFAAYEEHLRRAFAAAMRKLPRSL